MRRIDRAHTRIEHWKPEAMLTETEKIDYSNMLAVCYTYSEGMPEKHQTCDVRKGDKEIKVDPRLENHIASIGYKKGSGIIFSDDYGIDTDLNEKLNLNCMEQNLPQNRQTVLQRVIIEMNSQRKKGNWKRSDVGRMLRLFTMPDEDGKKKEYAGIVIWYLTRKMGSLNAH